MGAAWSGRLVTRRRAEIRARGQYQPCGRCGHLMDLDVDVWHAGHIIDRALGGGHQPSNLRPEHERCSTRAGAKLRESMKAARRRAVVEREQRLRRW